MSPQIPDQDYIVRRTHETIQADGALFCFIREFLVSAGGKYTPSRRFVQATGYGDDGCTAYRWSLELTVTEQIAEKIRPKYNWALNCITTRSEKPTAYVVKIPGELEIEFRSNDKSAGSITISDPNNGRKVSGSFDTIESLRSAVSSILRLGTVEEFEE